jgi:hypothetical protein
MYVDPVREARPELSISGPQDQSREVHATTITFREKLELEVSKTWAVRDGSHGLCPQRWKTIEVHPILASVKNRAA